MWAGFVQVIGDQPWSAMIPLGLILLAVCIELALPSVKGRPTLSRATIALCGLLTALVSAWFLWPEAKEGGFSTLVFDRLAMIGIMITSLVSACVVLLSSAYLWAREAFRSGYFLLLLLVAFGQGVLVAADDLITMLIALECISIGTYALIAFLRERPASVEAAMKYFILGGFMTALLCMGIAFLFGSLGTTHLDLIAERAAYVMEGEARHLFLFGLSLLVVGLAFRLALVPFHAWAPDVFDGAPTPVALLIASGTMAAVGIALLRVGWALALPGGAAWENVLWALGALSILWGGVAALKQQNFKRLLAYASIGQAGFFLIAFPALAQGTIELGRAGVIMVISTIPAMIGAFAALVAIGFAPEEPVDIRHLSGLFRKRPWLTFCLSLCLLSLAGLPPTFGFLGKAILLLAAMRADQVALVVVALVGTLLLAIALLRPVVAMVAREERRDLTFFPREMPAPLLASVIATLAAASMLTLLFGMAPLHLIAFVEASIP